MRTVVALAFLALASVIRAAATWPDAAFTEVRGYAYNIHVGVPHQIMHHGRLDSSVVNTHGVPLNAQQIKRLLSAVTGIHPAPEWAAACFNPRHAFVFYDAQRHPVAWVELCFECSNAAITPSRPKHDLDVGALEQLATELKLPHIPK